MSSLLRKIKQKLADKYFLRIILNRNFKRGYKSFLETGTTSKEAYFAMLKLYCLTNGKFNETFNSKLILNNPPDKTPEVIDGGVIGKVNKKEFSSINEKLNQEGYANLNNKLPVEMTRRLYEYALQIPALTPPYNDSKNFYDELHPVSEIYKLDMLDLINNRDIQDLIMNPVLINVARNYLECEPIFDFPAMWWSTTFLKEASTDAAQLYHFDLDRIKWLKIFFYLNEVTPENGPHCYIKGSHRSGNKPKELLKRGYARIPDSDLKKYYRQEDFIEICGEVGTIFAGDTKCWHKGKRLEKGHRLVLEFEYTTSMFGANYPKLKVQQSSDAFKEFCRKNIRYSSNIYFDN